MYKFKIAVTARFLTPSFFVLAGILPVLFFYNLIPVFIILCCVVILAALGIGGFYCSRPGFRKIGLSQLALSLGLFLGVLFAQSIEYEDSYFFTGVALPDVASYQGCLAADAEAIGNDLYQCEVRLARVAAKGNSLSAQAGGKVKLFLKNGMRLHAGEIIRVHGTLKLNQKNTPHSIDSWVDLENIGKLGHISWFYQVRDACLGWLQERINLLGKPLSGFFQALFLGNREDLEQDLKDGFYNTGSAHLLALSGLHVGLVYALIGFALYPLSSKRLKIVIGSILVLAYLFLVGPRPSLLRASLMLVTGGAAMLLHREFNPYNIIFLCLILSLFIDPAAIYTLAFALTYCAVFGILTLGRWLNSFLVPYLPSFLRVPLALSVGAQAATLPFVIKYFGLMYPLSFVAALLLIPLVTIFIWGGIIILFLSFIPFTPLFDLLRLLLSLVYELIMRVSQFFSQIPVLAFLWNDWYWIPFLVIMGFSLVRIRLRQKF